MGFAVYVSNGYKDENDVGALVEFDDKLSSLYRAAQMPYQLISSATVRSGLRPLNFSIDRYTKVVQDTGSFSRMAEVPYGVVLMEFVTVTGKTMGYRVLCVNSSIDSMEIKDMYVKDIVELERKLGRPYLQNGIVRNNTVNCYPKKSFIRIVVRKDGKKQQKVSPVRNVSENRNPKARVKSKGVVKPPETMNSEQKGELTKCQKHGVDPELINDSKLTPEQMRVLWVAKSKGCLAEYFAHPDYDVDVMKFYGDRLFSQDAVKAYSPMLQRRDLTVDQLGELGLCIDAGLDYTGLMDLSASNIAVKRYEFEQNKVPVDTSVSIDDDEVMFGKVLGAVARSQYGI